MFARALVVGLLALAPTLAFAYPAVGDKAEWSGFKHNWDGTATPMKVTMTVTAWDDATKTWTVTKDVMVDTTTTTTTMMTKCLPTPESAAMILAKCVEMGGRLESVTTPTGTYNTCAGFMGSPETKLMKTWMADVPFGMVKKWMSDATDSSTTTMELTAVTLGQ
ncbi:hypothetical protein [Bdellovibrio sp. NC01]|uniref:hypothetical protein n=1 Tax=Bdellovibrio sp. NC01 TaxID=2220073 RepID=UPI0011586E12|nr:hypothetical protein [Bdellovibrio sp. NC01]QDK37021.1 hypothetical protein DOE51_05135 [Bdellovibrio sp. NC01]